VEHFTYDGTDYTKMRFLREFAVAGGAVVGGTQVLSDDGAILPGSRRAILKDERTVSFGELLSPSARDLAEVDSTDRFTVDFEQVWFFISQYMT